MELRSKVGEVIEIYAGMEGYKPVTALEAYQSRIIKQMYNAVTKLNKEKLY